MAIKPKKAAFFGEFNDYHLIPFIKSNVTDVTTRVDGVWENYKKIGSLKAPQHDKRGETANRRTRITATTPIPKGKQYNKFLNDLNNKSELFPFLAIDLAEKLKALNTFAFFTFY